MQIIDDNLLDEFYENSNKFDQKSLKYTRPPCCYTCNHLMYTFMHTGDIDYHCEYHRVFLTRSIVSDLVYKICDNYKPAEITGFDD